MVGMFGWVGEVDFGVEGIETLARSRKETGVVVFDAS